MQGDGQHQDFQQQTISSEPLHSDRYQQSNAEPASHSAEPPCPENHLAKAILVTLLCCWPLGIPAIVYAAKVNTLYNQRRYREAEEASRNADKWFLISLVGGIIGIIGYFFLLIFLNLLA